MENNDLAAELRHHAKNIYATIVDCEKYITYYGKIPDTLNEEEAKARTELMEREKMKKLCLEEAASCMVETATKLERLE